MVIDKSCSDISRKRFVAYDPDPFVNLNAKTYTRLQNSRASSPARAQSPHDKKGKPSSSADVAVEVARIISAICTDRIDITGPYGQWFEIGCALANEFGEPGRDMFHAVSQFGDYDPEQTNHKFGGALDNECNYGIGTCFQYAKLAGVDAVRDFREYWKGNK